MLCGLALGLATLTKPSSQYVPACYIVFLVASFRRQPGVAGVYSILVLLAFGLVLSPWALRNRESFDSLSLSTSGSYNLLALNVVPMEMAKNHIDAGSARDSLMAEVDRLIEADRLVPGQLTEFQRARYWRAVAFRHISGRPFAFAKVLAEGVFHTFFNLDTRGYIRALGLRTADFDIKAYDGISDTVRGFLRAKGVGGLCVAGIVGVFVFVSYLGAMIGLFGWWKQHDKLLLCLMVTLIAYFSLVAGAGGLARFKLPLIPFYVGFAAVGLQYAKRRTVSWAWLRRVRAPLVSSFSHTWNASGIR
jgi:4-amino-4-deoxy-L-arabinose transferase-like glycosyltransferase